MRDDDWISTRVTRASEHLPLVTQDVLARMKALLVGELSQRQLSKTELSHAAEELIRAMAPVAPRTEAEQ